MTASPVKMTATTSDSLLSRRDGEFLRVLASIAVVTVHSVHQWVQPFAANPQLLSLGSFAAILDQLSRFTLPVFFFLSGFGLTLQTVGKPIPLREYYTTRLIKIGAPFFLWSFLTSFRHILWIESWDWRGHTSQSFAALWHLVFIDGIDYQYYFLIVIFQFYLVFPFIYKYARSRWAALAALLVHLGVTSPIETYLEVFHLKLPAFHSNVLILHFFWCFMGIHIAWNREAIGLWVQRWSRGAILGFWLVAFALLHFEFLFNIYQKKALSDIDHFNRWSVVVYGIACMVLFMKNKDWLIPNVIRNPKWDFLFIHVAPYTFFVYLAHTHVLRWIDYFFEEQTTGDFLWRVVSVPIASYLLAWLTQWLLEEFPRLRFGLGLPKQPLLLRETPILRLARLSVARFISGSNTRQVPTAFSTEES